MKSVLLVDDDDVFQYSLKRTAKKIPEISEMTCASNGKEALDFIIDCLKKEKSLPDLVLLDINMPVMNGFEFFDQYKILNEKYKDQLNYVMFAILTSSEQDKDRERAMATGFVKNYMVKPSGNAEAAALLRKMME